MRIRNNGLTVTPVSHVDHGLSDAAMDYIIHKYADRSGFFIDTFELPRAFGKVDCALYGPICGDAPVDEDEVHYAVRGSRPGESRMIHKPLRKTRTVTVIAGPHAGNDCVLYTAFGGPLSPQEPFDPNLTPEKQAVSDAFWAQHALATGEKAPRSRRRKNASDGPTYRDDPESGDEYIYSIIRAGGEHAVEVYKLLNLYHVYQSAADRCDAMGQDSSSWEKATEEVRGDLIKLGHKRLATFY